jgi:hypothetical protein
MPAMSERNEVGGVTMHELMSGIAATLYMTVLISLPMILALAVWDGLKWAVKEVIRRARREQN